MKASAYRDMSLEDLRSREEEARRSLFNLRVRATTRELENVSQIKHEKRELARILTVIREKLGEGEGQERG